MEIKQVSIFVENKAGRLAAILEVLEKNQINIRAMSVSDAPEIGIVRLILSDADSGLAELRRAGFTTRMDRVITTEIPDLPGGLLRHVVKPLSEAGVNLEYFYAYSDSSTNQPVAVIKTDDLEKAETILNK
jgi:hypothetical protein